MKRKTFESIMLVMFVVIATFLGVSNYISLNKENIKLSKSLTQSEYENEKLREENSTIKNENKAFKDEISELIKKYNKIQGQYKELDKKYQKEIAPVNFQD